MAHYAFLDDRGFVTEVITGKEEGEEGIDWEQRYEEIRGQKCKRTSYNTKRGIHYDRDTGQPSGDQSKAFRKNFAGIGFKYDRLRDAFIPPRPHSSWVFNEEACVWDAPFPVPSDEGTGDPPKVYVWDDITDNWVAIPK